MRRSFLILIVVALCALSGCVLLSERQRQLIGQSAADARAHAKAAESCQDPAVRAQVLGGTEQLCDGIAAAVGYTIDDTAKPVIAVPIPAPSAPTGKDH